jgi:RNA polymerase sigma-70 factor (ECF subfamily)
MPAANRPTAVADLAALGKLCEEHRARLLAMLDRRIDVRLRQRLSPEDILQQAYLKAQGRWPEYQAGSPMRPYPWLYRLALDTLYEEYARNGCGIRDLAREIPWPDESSARFGERLAGSGTSPSGRLAREELVAQVRQVLDLLQPLDREILWMRFFEDLSARDVGELVGLTEGAVNTRLFRTMRKLEGIWCQLYGDPGSMP